MRRRGRTGRCDPVRFGDAGNFSYIRFDVSFKTGRSDDGSGPSSDRRSVRSVPEGADPLPKRTIAATRVMKKRMLLLAACVAAVGCTTPELEHLPPKGPEAESLLTLAEARAWYDSGASVATRGETECRPADLFRTGPLRPDWSRGVLSADRRLSAVDVPAAGRYAYGVVYDSLVVPIHTGLLVLKEADDGTMCDYTAFYIPRPRVRGGLYGRGLLLFPQPRAQAALFGPRPLCAAVGHARRRRALSRGRARGGVFPARHAAVDRGGELDAAAVDARRILPAAVRGV